MKDRVRHESVHPRLVARALATGAHAAVDGVSRDAIASDATEIAIERARTSPYQTGSVAAVAPVRRWPRGTLYQLEHHLDVVHQRITAIKLEASRVLIGLDALVHGLLLGLFAGGHVLVDGPPGSARTLVARTLAATLGATFARIELTPDLAVSDLVGSIQAGRSQDDSILRRGPIFANVVLADGLDRGPPSVQAALLEAMRESGCRMGEHLVGLPTPFFVVATSTWPPHERTTPIRAAHLDRFLLSLVSHAPHQADELRILDQAAGAAPEPVAAARLTPAGVVHMREVMRQILVEDQIKRYAIDVVTAIRDRTSHCAADPLLFVGHGAPVAAAIALVKVARAHALLDNRAYVAPVDVKRIAPAVLRHRIALRSDDTTPLDEVIAWIVDRVPVP